MGYKTKRVQPTHNYEPNSNTSAVIHTIDMTLEDALNKFYSEELTKKSEIISVDYFVSDGGNEYAVVTYKE